MSEEQTTIQVKQQISQIRALDMSRLYPDGAQVSPWNNYSREGIKKFVDSTYSMLVALEKRKDLDLCGFTILNNISSHLTAFINSYSTVTGLVDAQISTQHHQALTYLNTINDFIRSSGLYTELKLDPKENFSKISEALTFGDTLLANKTAFEETSEIFKSALGDKDEFVKKLLLEKSELFERTADEYRTFKTEKYVLLKSDHSFVRYFTTFTNFYGSFWQMILALLFGLGIMVIVYSFIEAIKGGQSISVGVAILRVSALIVPSYFAFFFSRQFQLSQKMYKFYKFKSVALSTMSNLYAAYPTQQDKIIDKALAVIFSEFSEKNTDLSQKDVLDFAAKLIQK